MTIRSMRVLPSLRTKLALCMSVVALLAFSSLGDSVWASRLYPSTAECRQAYPIRQPIRFRRSAVLA
ncbi:hypothetical protein ACWEVM_07955 [Streptomyces bauhiniae]|uniref:hypothetical protein n=1 Tax=Streptomyces bauhiniae TaxID=2340725 RepID=UPI003652A572